MMFGVAQYFCVTGRILLQAPRPALTTIFAFAGLLHGQGWRPDHQIKVFGLGLDSGLDTSDER